MKKVFFTPGPTELYPEVKKYINDALNENVCSINHRSIDFMDIYKSTVSGLKKLLNIPDDYTVFFLGSATECMDRVIQNCVEERSYHFVNGAFAERFFKTAIDLNKKAEKMEVPYGEGFDFQKTEIENDPELICITQNETSTGVAIAPEDIYKLKEKYPQSLVAVDIVTSAPYVTLDYNKIDCSFLSVQKGFGMPAGLGVLIANKKCIDKSFYLKSKRISIGSYHNFISLYENAKELQTTETPNVLSIYLLGRICQHLNSLGVQNMRESTETKAEILYHFFDGHPDYKPFVKDPAIRSKTIINIDVNGDQKEVKEKFSSAGIIVGSGYGGFKESQIRIANFPMHTISQVHEIISLLHHE